ncbi:MAG: hypothetical protein O7D34_08860 [Ignavibacteria bacterium]|nr:hypothetical protein [Ignavibacteria bacterium]
MTYYGLLAQQHRGQEGSGIVTSNFDQKANTYRFHVHKFRVTAPPIRYPSHYGMDFPSPKELIANQCDGDVEKFRRELDVDSLEYLSLEDLLDSVPYENGADYCTACFSGKYPVQIDGNQSKEEHEA